MQNGVSVTVRIDGREHCCITAEDRAAFVPLFMKIFDPIGAGASDDQIQISVTVQVAVFGIGEILGMLRRTD